MALSLGYESFDGRGLARKGMDKHSVGVTSFNVAVWRVGEREATQEACLHCHTTKRMPGVWHECAVYLILRFPWPARTLSYLEIGTGSRPGLCLLK